MKKLLTVCLLLAPVYGFCQEIIFDLSNDKFVKRMVSPGTKTIQLTNTLSSKIYKVSAVYTDVVRDLPAPFSTSSVSDQNTGADHPLLDNKKCPGGDALAAKILVLKSASGLKSESELKAKYGEIIDDISKLESPCKEDAIGILNDALKSTIVEQTLTGVKTCQIIYLTIERYSADNNLEKIWNDTLQTTCPERPNKWLVYYGFTYQPNIISRYDNYFSKKLPGTDSFAVRKLNGDQSKFWENLSPTVMFTYMLGNKYQDIKFGISGIAATNFSSFSAGFGASMVIGYNFNIGAGVMFTQKNVLNGMYKEGDTIRENLSFDQLHTKKWGPEVFFSLGFRFDKNPFSKSSSSGSSASAKNGTNTKPDPPAADTSGKKKKTTNATPGDKAPKTTTDGSKANDTTAPKPDNKTKDKEEVPIG